MKLLSRDPSKSKARLSIIWCNNLGDLSLPFSLSSDDRIGAKTSSGGQLGTTTMDQLKGKVAIVTGAASGIGAACGETLARGAAQVVATDIDDPSWSQKSSMRAEKRSACRST
jgi:hypothetical protein